MGKRDEPERLILRWPVKRTRARRASQGVNSQSCLPLARLLEREDSQQAQLATHGEILPGLPPVGRTECTEIPSTLPASRTVEEFFVPDSPEEIWLGKDNRRHRGPFTLTRKRPLSIKFVESVVPDSPEDTREDSPCKFSQIPVSSELVVPDSPDDTGTSNDLSYRPFKWRRTTRARKFHQTPSNCRNEAILRGNCSELISSVRTAKSSGKLSFKDAADPWACDPQHCDRGILVLPAVEQTSSAISDKPFAMDSNRNLDHQMTQLDATPEVIRTSWVTDGLATSLPILSFSGVNGILPGRCDAGMALEDEELHRYSNSPKTIVYQEEFRSDGPALYVPDTEEEEGAPVTPFSTSTMLAPSPLVLENSSGFHSEGPVKETEIFDTVGAGFQNILDINANRATPSSTAIAAPTTPFPITIGKPTSMKKASRDETDGAGNCSEFFRAGNLRDLKGNVQASGTYLEDTVPSSCFVTGSGKPVPVSPTAFRKVRVLLEAEVEGTETGAEFSRADLHRNLQSSLQTSSKIIDAEDASMISVLPAMEKTSLAFRDVALTHISQSVGSPLPISALVAGSGTPISVSSVALECRSGLRKSCNWNGYSEAVDRGNSQTIKPLNAEDAPRMIDLSISRGKKVPVDQAPQNVIVAGNEIESPGAGDQGTIHADAQTVKLFDFEHVREINLSLVPTGKKLSDDQASPKVTQSGNGNISSRTGDRGDVPVNGHTVKLLNTAHEATGKLAERKNLADDQTPLNVIDDAIITSFVSGSGKPVSVSSLALKKVRALLGDELEVSEICAEPGGAGHRRNVHGHVQISTISHREDQSPTNSAPARRKILSDANRAPHVTDDAVPVTSFVTGSGQRVSVSSTTLQKVRAVLGDEFAGYEDCAQQGETGYQGILRAELQTSNFLFNEVPPKRPAIGKNVSSFGDFASKVHKSPITITSSARGSEKFESVSSEALERARATFDETGVKTEKMSDRIRSSEAEKDGYSTSRRNPAATSKENSFPSKKAEIPLDDQAEDTSCAGMVTLSAFSTASGGRVSVSALAMRKARELLRDEVENVDHSTDSEIVGRGNQLASVKRVYQEGKVRLGDEDKETHVDFQRKSFHSQLSRSSDLTTHRIRKLRPLSEIQTEGFAQQSADKGEKVGNAQTGKSGGSCSSQRVQNEEISLIRSSSVSEEAIQAAEFRLARPLERKGNILSELPEQAIDDPIENITFKTGSGRTVAISREAMEKAKALLADSTTRTPSRDCQPLNLPIPTKVLTPAHTFRTLSMRKLAISSEAMSRASDLLPPVQAVPPALTSSVIGSGKSESVSSRALEKARALRGEEYEEIAPVAVTSFMTGSGKSVSISSKALEKARALLGDELEERVDGTSDQKEVKTESHFANLAQTSVTGNEPSTELQLSTPDTSGSLSAKLTPTVGEHQWRNARAFKPPRIQKQPNDTVNSKGSISTSIFGAHSCGNQRHSFDTVTVTKSHQRLQPLKPTYLKDGRSGWMRLREYIDGTPANISEVLLGKGSQVLSPAPEVRSLTPDAAGNYRIHHVTKDGREENVGSTEMWNLLLDLGADPYYSSKEWVANHYKWIIWKLTCSERKHPRQSARRRLNFNSVLEELKYRYDTELSGRRSAIRRITEGDSSASRAMVLLVSAVRHYGGTFEKHIGNASSSGSTAKIEVTDGWYRLNSIVDAPLTKYLGEGKLSVGQKIQVCGATLCCCPDPTSPLEAFKDSYLSLHVNGTFRARYNHRLGFCTGPVPPLAFRCIKPAGGLVPKTYVAVVRVYPILFKETSADGFSIIRSVRAEELALNEFERRRAKVAEEAVVKVENCCDPSKSQEEKDEGHYLFDAVERAAEPDVLMAEMTTQQLKSLAIYQAKKEMSRQATLEDAVKEALKDAGLHSRNVARVLKVRVTGLQRRKKGNGQAGQQRKEGMISIWDASDEQDIKEGSVYCVSGLRPFSWSTSSNHNQIQLQSYRSTSWRHVPEAIYEKEFWFPYTCRAATRLRNLDEKSVYREFDIAAKVLVVDEPFHSGSRTNQWVFVTDGSVNKNSPEDAWDEIQILAVKVSLPALAFAPFETSLIGSVVGFCNLTQQPKDHNCHWWVAEASEFSVFSSNLGSLPVKHLQTAATCVMEWDKLSPWASDMLRNLIQAMMSQGPQWYSF